MVRVTLRLVVGVTFRLSFLLGLAACYSSTASEPADGDRDPAEEVHADIVADDGRETESLGDRHDGDAAIVPDDRLLGDGDPDTGSRCVDGIVDRGEECDDANDIAWDGCNACAVVEFQVNTYTTGPQHWPDVAIDAVGRFVAVWASWEEDGSEWGIFGQRYGEGSGVGGPRLADEFQVNTYAEGWQGVPAVAMSPDGRFVVLWRRDHVDRTRSLGVFAQLYGADGMTVGGEFQVDLRPSQWQDCPSAAMAADGSFTAVWSIREEVTTGTSLVFARRFDATGSPSGPEFQVNASLAGSAFCPSMGMAPDGSFVIAWNNGAADVAGEWRDDVFVRRFDAAGEPLGGEFQVNADAGTTLTFPSVAAFPSGFVVAWQGDLWDGGEHDILGQRFDADGDPVGSEFQVNSWTAGSQERPQAAAGSDGRFVVAWRSVGQDGDGWGVYAQRLDAAGAPDGAEFRLHVWTSGNQWVGSTAMTPDGRFVAIWSSESGQDGDSEGVFAQRYDASGRAVGPHAW